MSKDICGKIYYECIGGDRLGDIAKMMVKISRTYNKDCIFILNEREYFVERPLSVSRQVELILNQHKR